jgi:hypothetical protein
MNRFALFLLALTNVSAAVSQTAPDDAVKTLVPWLFKQDRELRSILFSDVIEAATGKKIVPFSADDADDQRIVAGVSGAMDRVLEAMNADEKVKSIRRINEVSSHFENLMRTTLNTVPDFSCDFPKTKTGQTLRSGYPDLRLVDKKTGRIFYLDPKLYEHGSRESTFRTFYFEPRQDTNKVNDDAHHFIVGIEHDRDESGWRFTRWELVDLSNFRVKLKAEFEGSNRDMYRPEAIVGSGPK